MVAGLLLVVGLYGCQNTRVRIPTRQADAWYHVPAQQEVVSDAINAAVASFDAKKFADKKVYVEALGVYPHTDRELLDYCVDSIRSQMARAGAQIIFPRLIQATQPATMPVMAPPDPESVDYIVNVAVEKGGADQRSEYTALHYSGTAYIDAKARLRVSAYPTKSKDATVSTINGEATRPYRKWVFWFIDLTPEPSAQAIAKP
jgi:hypothetical protein